MAERRSHEAGSSTAACQAKARSKQSEREDKFLVDQVLDGEVAVELVQHVVRARRRLDVLLVIVDLTVDEV